MLLHFFSWLFLLFGMTCPTTNAEFENSADTKGQLILFTQNTDQLTNDDLLALKDLAQSMQIDFVQKDIKQGAPPEVTLTPMILFQNHLGRSVYNGRYKNTSRIKNFIRTASRLPKKSVSNIKDDLLIAKMGRAVIAAPVKITAITGKIPKGYEEEQFKYQAKVAFGEGMKKFEFSQNYNLPYTSRSFYVNLYPYASKRGKLSLTMEIFSQFNCIDPIYVQFDEPMFGKWRKVNALFEMAGKRAQKEIFNQMAQSKIGDDFQIITNETPYKDWTEIDLALPIASDKNEIISNAISIDLVRSWVVDNKAKMDGPRVQFSFPPPLDSYAGEATDLTGKLRLSPEKSLEGMTGKFIVKTASVTMGDKGLDQAIHDKMIKVKDYPASSFEIQEVDGDFSTLSFGQINHFQTKGLFEMMGKKTTVVTTGQVEPMLNDQGEPRLQFMINYTLNLKKDYNIDGPDGPSPAKDQMTFSLFFIMQPGI